MTEQIKSAIGVIKGLYRCRHELSANECVGRHCNQCEYFSEKGKEDKSLKLAIRSLQTWEEVLQKLEEIKEDDDTLYIHIRLRDAIDVINQKLVEIEE